MKNNHDAIFFDLDGTLLDTAPDLYTAMLLTLAQLERKPVSFDVFRPNVHTGTASMITYCFNISENDPTFNAIRKRFLENYENTIHKETDYFLGMTDVLECLDTQNILWGIVTNKPSFLTNPLIASFQLDKRAKCIVSGDTLPRRKPHPDPLLHACKLIGINPKKSAYIGDTRGDVIAAKAAGMTSIAACYGYHEPSNPPHTWGADYLIENPKELLGMLELDHDRENQ